MTADLLIRGAIVYDGTGAPPAQCDVALRDGRILSVGAAPDQDARDTLDASGMALAPGFIDIHTHDDAAAFAEATIRPKISQGVTTVVTGNCGISLAPSPLALRPNPVPPLDLLGLADAYRFETFAAYLSALEAACPLVNVAPLVGHTVLRARAMADLDRPATPAEIDSMRADLSAALDSGAIGLSTGLAYPPAKYATTDEIAILVSDVAAAGGLWTTHMRDERSGVVAAVAETIDIARRTGARTLISHHKCCGPAAFGLSRTTLAMIEAAQAELRIDLDVYPYTASSTVLLESFVRDSRTVTISWSEPHPEAAGRDLTEIASNWGLDVAETLDRLRPGGAIYHQMDDGDLERIMTYPPSVIGSDGLPRDRRPHPRLWGSFPRVLGHFARQRGLMPLEKAVAKMTGQSAAILGLSDRGIIREGARADLVLFDPERIVDAATYDAPTRPAEGIVRVIVNGQTAWQNGAAAARGAGTVLARRPAPA